VPEDLLRRFDKVYTRVNDLTESEKEIFVDDMLTASENRLKVFKK
jgi:hypothetical protein